MTASSGPPRAGLQPDATRLRQPLITADGEAALLIPNRLLTTEELAAYLAVSVGWVRMAVAGRTIPYTKIGRNVRFSPSQVEEILNEGERQALDDAEPPARRRTSARNKL